MSKLHLDQIDTSLAPENVAALAKRLEAGGVDRGRAYIKPVPGDPERCRLMWRHVGDKPVDDTVELARLRDVNDLKAATDSFLRKWWAGNGS